jgi:hypothetical protein
VRVLAVRDDGAQLIGEDDLSCGMLQSPDGSVILPVASILARGYWRDPVDVFGEAALRDGDEELIKQTSAEFDKHASIR